MEGDVHSKSDTPKIAALEYVEDGLVGCDCENGEIRVPTTIVKSTRGDVLIESEGGEMEGCTEWKSDSV